MPELEWPDILPVMCVAMVAAGILMLFITLPLPPATCSGKGEVFIERSILDLISGAPECRPASSDFNAAGTGTTRPSGKIPAGGQAVATTPLPAASGTASPDSVQAGSSSRAGVSGTPGSSSGASESHPAVATTTISSASPESGSSASPSDFLINVGPARATAAKGSTITYTLSLTPYNGFSKPVLLSLDVRALLLYHQVYDLGTLEPPFPKEVRYNFTVPDYVPSGVTIEGTVIAAGGGLTREVPVILSVT